MQALQEPEHRASQRRAIANAQVLQLHLQIHRAHFEVKVTPYESFTTPSIVNIPTHIIFNSIKICSF